MENISAIEDIITAHPADAFIRLQLDLCVSSIIFGYFKNLVTIAPNRLNCKDFTVFTFITTIIVKSVGKVALFTSSFPSSPRPWPNVDQNVNVSASNGSVISQH